MPRLCRPWRLFVANAFDCIPSKGSRDALESFAAREALSALSTKMALILYDQGLSDRFSSTKLCVHVALGTVLNDGAEIRYAASDQCCYLYYLLHCQTCVVCIDGGHVRPLDQFSPPSLGTAIA